MYCAFFRLFYFAFIIRIVTWDAPKYHSPPPGTAGSKDSTEPSSMCMWINPHPSTGPSPSVLDFSASGPVSHLRPAPFKCITFASQTRTLAMAQAPVCAPSTLIHAKIIADEETEKCRIAFDYASTNRSIWHSLCDRDDHDAGDNRCDPLHRIQVQHTVA
uniref:Uncharacterized protein n=2 Tax=Anopheles culicifacies TaxID=139723 RepID=A0A182MJP0_9DIPT